MDTNKRIARAMLKKSFAEAKELVFKSLYAKASLALDEARYAVANAIFNEAKKSPATSVPAGASEEEHAKARAANPYRVRLQHPGKPAGAVDKAVKEEAELDEMAMTKARENQLGRKMVTQSTAQMRSFGTSKHPSEYRKSRELQKQYDKEDKSKKTYGINGKVVKK
jgi:hypothetical protein